MGVQIGQPIGFVVAPTTAMPVGQVLSFQSSQPVQARWFVGERALFQDNRTTPSLLMGSFRPWSSYQGSDEHSVVDVNGGVNRPARGNSDAMTASWERTPLKPDSPSVQANPVSEQWRKLDEQLIADENILRGLHGAFKLGADLPSDLILRIYSQVSPIAMRVRHFYKDLGLSNQALLDKRTPAIIVRRFHFIRGATYRTMAALALQGRPVDGSAEFEDADIAEMFMGAGQSFFRLAGLLKEADLMSEAAEYYMESARLVETASLRIHSLGERCGDRLATSNPTLSQAMLSGYLEAYHIYEQIHDYRQALRAAIVWARVSLRGWESVSHNRFGGLPFDGKPQLSHAIPGHPTQTARCVLKDALWDFRSYSIDKDHLSTEDAALIEEAESMLERLSRT